MKLTKTIRDAFVRAAMQDLPSIDFNEKVRVLLQADAIAQLPPALQRIAKDSDLCCYLRTESYWTPHGLANVSVYCQGRDWKPSEKANTALQALVKERNEQDSKHSNLRGRLNSAAYACSTRKALAEMLPEFEKYLPADEPAALRTVPVVTNLVADFTKAGWPKGAKTSSAKAAA